MNLLLYFILFSLLVLSLNAAMIIWRQRNRQPVDWLLPVVSLLLLLLLYMLVFL